MGYNKKGWSRESVLVLEVSNDTSLENSLTPSFNPGGSIAAAIFMSCDRCQGRKPGALLSFDWHILCHLPQSCNRITAEKVIFIRFSKKKFTLVILFYIGEFFCLERPKLEPISWSKKQYANILDNHALFKAHTTLACFWLLFKMKNSSL